MRTNISDAAKALVLTTALAFATTSCARGDSDSSNAPAPQSAAQIEEQQMQDDSYERIMAEEDIDTVAEKRYEEIRPLDPGAFDAGEDEDNFCLGTSFVLPGLNGTYTEIPVTVTANCVDGNRELSLFEAKVNEVNRKEAARNGSALIAGQTTTSVLGNARSACDQVAITGICDVTGPTLGDR